MGRRTRTILGALVLAGALAASGCASPPWVCTPETCVSVASEDLPPGIRGSWRAADGSTLRVLDYHIGTIDGEVAPKAASIDVILADGDRQISHITSFDGVTVVGETYLGGEMVRKSRSPRRFCRLDLSGDQLSMSALRLEAMMQEAVGDDVQIVEFEGEDAVAYTDVRAMAATLVLLTADPDAWDDAIVFEQAGASEEGPEG